MRHAIVAMLLDKPYSCDRIELRSLDPDECHDRYLDWLRDPVVTQCLEVRFHDYDAQRLREYIAEQNSHPDSMLLGMMLENGNRHIGNVRLSWIRMDHRNAEIGLLIGERGLWGHGYATEAISGICGVARDRLGLHKLRAGCYSNNPASSRAFLKAGFTQEGLLREERASDGKWVDKILLGRILS